MKGIHIIKNIVKNFKEANPCSDTFNGQFLANEFSKNIVGISLEKEEIQRAQDTIDALSKLNELYLTQIVIIKSYINELNINSFELIEYMFVLANLEHLNISELQRQRLDTDPNPFLDFDGHAEKIKTVHGQEANINEANDVSVDTLNEAITFLKSNSFKRSNKIKASRNNLLKTMHEMFFRFNIIVNIKTCFEYYKHEYSEFYISGDTIKAKHNPEFYHLLKVAGRQREQNLIMQGYTYASKLDMAPAHSTDYKISNGTFYAGKLSKEIDDISRYFATSTQVCFYSHLKNKITTKSFQFSVSDIFNFWSALRRVVAQIDRYGILREFLETDDRYNSIPIKIEKNELIEFLIQETRLEKKIVTKLLAHCTCFLNQNIDLWKYPLLSYGNFFYFSFIPLLGGHIPYFVDSILNEYIDVEEQEALFYNQVVKELAVIPSGYKFNKLSLNEELYLGQFIIYEMDKIVLYIQICLFNYPLNSEEYSEAMDEIAEASKLMEKNKYIFNETERKNLEIGDKEIVSVILSNHTCLSGINIENNFVIDEQLFMNYIKVGKLERSLLKFDTDGNNPQTLSSYSYYSNEEEFNSNLKQFLLIPFPIQEILKLKKVVEYPLLPPEYIPQIFEDGIDTITRNAANSTKIQELDYALKQLYYFEIELKAMEQTQLLDKKIEFIAPQILSLLSLTALDQIERLEVLDSFEKVDIIGMARLVFLLERAISSVSEKAIMPDLEEDRLNFESIDHERASKNLDLILNNNFTNPISFSTLELQHDLSAVEIEELIEVLIQVISGFEQKYYTEEELTQQIQWLSIFAALSRTQDKYRKLRDFAFSNFVDSLNYNHYYQKARDVSEEILSYSFKYDSTPTIGWFCHFKSALKQQSIHHAGFYGLLYIYSYASRPYLRNYEAVDILFSCLLFFRNFGFNDMVDNLYKSLDSIDLTPYNRQKITIAYYNSLLNRSPAVLESALPEISLFLEENIEHILHFGQQGAMPWLSLMYNIININSVTALKNSNFTQEYISKLEKSIDDTTLNIVKATYFAKDNDTKKVFRNALLRVFETRNYNDFASEIGNLHLLANNVMRMSLNPLDMDGLLLAGLVKNDNTLIFKTDDEELTSSPFYKGVNTLLSERISNYSKYIIDKINIKSDQVVCWLFNLYGQVYRLCIGQDLILELKALPKWDVARMKAWIAQVSDYYFDDKGDYPINEQESDYRDDLVNLSFAHLEIDINFKEVLLCTDLLLSEFPHNLMQNSINVNFESTIKHHDVVNEFVSKIGQDFISFRRPITNIISLEWYCENGDEVIYSLQELSMEIWIPIEDQDIVLNMGYEKMKPLLEQFNCKIHTSYLPKQPLSSIINIFFAHGGKGIEGFRAVYTAQSEEGKAILKGGGIKKVFGSGDIAILFICDSASVSEQIYIQKLVSFTHEILALGYKAVIAPAWHLNPDIAPVWLEYFIDALKCENSVSKAVQIANTKTALEKRYNEYHGYYSPTGWAAMHLYGNPNLRFEYQSPK